MVENYFGQLKKNTLDSQKNVKCSKFLWKLREDVLSLAIESDVNIKKERLTKIDSTDEKCSQESWQRKTKSSNTHFRGAFLKNQSIFSNNDDIIFPEDDTDTQICGYCGYGTFNEVTGWVQCDRCQKWIHQTCIDSDILPSINEKDFICKICLADTEIFNNPEHTNEHDLPNKCRNFLKNLILPEQELINLELATREQSLSNKWKEERKVRVTSSFFGRICKAKGPSSFAQIIKAIREGGDLKTPPIIYGRENEQTARQEYIRKTKTYCQSGGLCVYRPCQFLAASPDGLVGEEGIVEIKCPYSSRDSDPLKYKFDFLDASGKALKLTHNYYY